MSTITTRTICQLSVNGLTYKNPSSWSSKGKARLLFETIEETKNGITHNYLSAFSLVNDSDCGCISVNGLDLSKQTVETLANALLQAAKAIKE